MCLKIQNFYDMFGQPDYKGLDISKFIAGSQIYPEGEDFCYVATSDENVIETEDITLLTKEEYVTIRESYLAEAKQKIQTDEQRIADLEIAMAAIMGGAL